MVRREECVIFDMDGVLVDTAPFHLEAWRIFGEKRGKPVTSESFYKYFGMKNEEIFPDMFGPLAPDQIQVLSDDKESTFRSLIKGSIRPLLGVERLIRDLYDSGIRIGVGSSAPRENVMFILGELGIASMLNGIVTGDDVQRGKPDPSIFLGAAQKCGSHPHCCLVFEDALVGVAAAKAAEMACVAITTTTTKDNLGQADLVIGEYSQLTVSAILELIAKNRAGKKQKGLS